LIFGTEKHPFLNENGTINHRRILSAEYEKVKEGKYNSTLVNLMERMMDVG
jgi:hypothetical protein